MAEVYKNSFSPVTTKIFWGGQVVDADSSVLVDIYDITSDPTVSPLVNPSTPVLSNQQATKSEVDSGSYELNIPYSITNREKKLKLKWKYSVNSTQLSHDTFVNVVTPYASLSQAVEDLNVSLDQSDPNYKSFKDLVMAERYARKVIEKHTGQKFYLYNDVQVAYGSGSDILPLPYKLDSIQSLTENDIVLIDNMANESNWPFVPMVSESGFGIRVDRTDSLDNIVYTANGMIPPTINDTGGFGAFRKDARYRITGKFGWQEVPDDVQEAAVILMGEFFSKDRIWTDKYIKTISTFDWDFEYSSEAYSGTGNSYVDQLLYPYVLNNMVII